MSITFTAVTYDARNAAAVAEFWGAVLGREVAPGASPEHASLLADDVSVTGPRIGFHQVPEDKTVKNRLHIDLIATDFDAELQRLTGLGATRLAEHRQGGHWITLADPEGNEFDLIEG